MIELNLRKKYNSMSKELKASTAYTLCSLIQKGLSFITLPIFTRLLTKTQYGQFTVYSSWVTILTIFITLNLAYGTFQTAMVKFEGRRNEYTSSIALMFMCLGSLFLAIYLPFHAVWNRLFKLPTYIMVVMTVEIIFNGITDCWLSKNRFEFQYKSVIGLTLCKTLLSPILALILVKSFQEKGYARIIGYATINIIAGAALYFRIYSKGKTLFKKEYWKYAVSFNGPLIPYYISQMIFNTSDRLMIDHMIGTDQAAIYGVAYSLAIVLNFVISAINGSYIPWLLVQLKNRQGEKNRKVSLNLSIIIAIGLWLIIAIAPEFITIMAGKEYASGMWAVPPVAISILLLFYTQLFDRVLFFYEKKIPLIIGGIVPCIVNLVLNYLFIPLYGFVAAAYTTLISYMVFAAINYFAAQKTLKENNNNSSLYNLKGLILLFLVLCIMSGIEMFLYNYIVPRFIVVGIAAIVIVINRKRVIRMLKMES